MNETSDVWALGVVFLQIFLGESLEKIKREIFFEELSTWVGKVDIQNIQLLLKAMLDPDWEKRTNI